MCGRNSVLRRRETGGGVGGAGVGSNGGGETGGVGAGELGEDFVVAQEHEVGDGGDVVVLGDVGEGFGVDADKEGGGGLGGKGFKDAAPGVRVGVDRKQRGRYRYAFICTQGVAQGAWKLRATSCVGGALVRRVLKVSTSVMLWTDIVKVSSVQRLEVEQRRFGGAGRGSWLW